MNEKIYGSRDIKPSEIRDVIIDLFFLRLQAVHELKDNPNRDTILRDSFASLGLFGIPGVGKSILPKLGFKDSIMLLNEYFQRNVEVQEVSLQADITEAKGILEGVVEGRIAPILHANLPSTKIWTWEGTPSPQDYTIKIKDKVITYNLWRIDPFLVPFLDITNIVPVEKLVPPLIIMDEFNAVQNRQILASLFQLARGADLGRIKLNPLSLITFIGNTPETNILAEEELPLPLLDRMIKFTIRKPDIEGWLAFMNELYGENWDKTVGAYLTVNPEDFYRARETTQDIVTPRRWTNVAFNLSQMRKQAKLFPFLSTNLEARLRRIVFGNLPQDVASRFWSFLIELSKLRNIKLDINEILKKPELLENMSRPTVAYVILTVTSQVMKNYGKLPKPEKEKILEKLEQLGYYGEKVIGKESYSIIIGSLPAPVRLHFASKLKTESRERILQTQKKIRQYEEALNV